MTRRASRNGRDGGGMRIDLHEPEGWIGHLSWSIRFKMRGILVLKSWPNLFRRLFSLVIVFSLGSPDAEVEVSRPERTQSLCARS